MYNGFFLFQSKTFFARPLALEGYLPFPETSQTPYSMIEKDSPLFFSLLLLLELELELFDGVLTVCFLHAQMPFCLVSWRGLGATGGGVWSTYEFDAESRVHGG